MQREQLKQWDHVKLNFDDDPALEEGVILKLNSSYALIAGLNDGRGFWAPVRYDDIVEVVQNQQQDGINKGNLMSIAGKLDADVAELKKLVT